VDDSEYEYRLVGIVDHMGSADAGHYLSYINVENDKVFKPSKQSDPFPESESDTWLEFNDH
jgi:ubiquitin C-terminal hydrolase